MGEGCVFDVAESTGVIEKKGSWYSFKGEQLGQGREKSLLAAKEKEGLYEEIVRLRRKWVCYQVKLLFLLPWTRTMKMKTCSRRKKKRRWRKAATSPLAKS